jgi:hypothetical protein
MTIRLEGDPMDTPKDSSVVLNVIGVAVFAEIVCVVESENAP